MVDTYIICPCCGKKVYLDFDIRVHRDVDSNSFDMRNNEELTKAIEANHIELAVGTVVKE